MNITILGGGTAGWLTALITKRFYPDEPITVIESTDIGILGAGEGTVPHFIDVLDFLGIPVSDLVKHAKATLKLGIEFDNWHGDGTSYFHGFEGGDYLNFKTCDLLHMNNLMATVQMGGGEPLKDIHLQSILASQAKVPFAHANNIFAQDGDPILKLTRYGVFGLHFDARLLAEYLKNVAISRGINRVEGVVKKLETDKKGDIKWLSLTGGNTVPCDFLFDCSGFARVVIGKHFNSEWVSYTDQMPLDTAMPFFISHDDKNIKPQTTAIAMKHGWVWKIPVQGRYGCGYVFDSRFITEEQALEEVKEVFGDVESPRTFKFKAGMYKDTYVNNCLAIGLAQGFIEPLEATSIWVSCLNLIQFLRNNGVKNKSEQFRKVFNEACYNRNHQVVEFLYAHYLTERKDSEFWTGFRDNTKMLPELQAKLDLWAETPPTEHDGLNELFQINSWYQVADGCHLINRKATASLVKDLKLDARIYGTFNSYIRNLQAVDKTCISHEELINLLKGE